MLYEPLVEISAGVRWLAPIVLSLSTTYTSVLCSFVIKPESQSLILLLIIKTTGGEENSFFSAGFQTCLPDNGMMVQKTIRSNVSRHAKLVSKTFQRENRATLNDEISDHWSVKNDGQRRQPFLLFVSSPSQVSRDQSFENHLTTLSCLQVVANGLVNIWTTESCRDELAF